MADQAQQDHKTPDQAHVKAATQAQIRADKDKEQSNGQNGQDQDSSKIEKIEMYRLNGVLYESEELAKKAMGVNELTSFLTDTFKRSMVNVPDLVKHIQNNQDRYVELIENLS